MRRQDSLLARRLVSVILAGTVLCVAPLLAFAQAAVAGRFLTAVGDVRLVDPNGVSRKAARGSQVLEGDEIVTSAKSLGQLRMVDGTLLSIRAQSRLKIDKYSFAGEHDTKASAFVTLAVGGFRWLTGLIGKLHREGVRVTTPNATIGIRGTDFEPVYVPAHAAGRRGAVDPGAYVRVYSGEVSLQNLGGIARSVLPNQVAFAPVTGAPPVILRAIPRRIYPSPTPLPKLAPEGRGDDDNAGGEKGAVRRPALLAPAAGKAALSSEELKRSAPTRSLVAPTASPVAPTTTLTAPTTTLIAPTLISPITSPIAPTTTLTAPTTTLIAPTTTTLTAPTTTLTAPTTTTLTAPTTTLTAPTTTLIAPTTTLIAPTSTTIAPTTTLIAPTTTLTAPTTSTLIKR
jgi:FecR protein